MHYNSTQKCPAQVICILKSILALQLQVLWPSEAQAVQESCHYGHNKSGWPNPFLHCLDCIMTFVWHFSLPPNIVLMSFCLECDYPHILNYHV